MSRASAEGWPFRNASFERKRVRPVATQIGNDDPVTFSREQRRDVNESLNVIRPAVQENSGVPFAGPASTYPTFKSPAWICFTGPSEVTDSGLLILTDVAPNCGLL